MSQWIRVAAVRDCPPGTSCEVVADERIIALFNVDGAFYATDGVCPHQGGPLAKGSLEGCIVTCPWHGWQFDVRSGQHQTSPLMHPRIALKVEGDDILVDVGC